MIDQLARVRASGLLGDGNVHGAIGGDRQAGSLQPRRRAVEPDARTGEQVDHDRLGRAGIGEDPAGGRRVECHAEAQVAGRGHGGRPAQGIGDAPREVVGAVMAAEHWNDMGAVLGKHDHRRVGPFVAEHRRQQADQGTEREHRNDRPAGGEERAQMLASVGKGDGTAIDTRLEAVDLCTVEGGGCTPRHIEGGRGQYDNGRSAQYHSSPPW
jgi:hypothetical protein